MKIIIDTNIIMNEEFSIKDYEKVYVPIIVVEELDNHKMSQDPVRAYKARQAMRQLDNANNVEYILESLFKLPEFLESTKMDNKILSFAKDISDKYEDVIFLVNDKNLFIKSKAIGIKCDKFSGGLKDRDIYKGYKKLYLNTNQINELFDNPVDFVTNEYLILHNIDLDNVCEYRFDGEKFSTLKLPSSKIIKGLNSLQRCALDLLNNKDIGIVAVNGEVGSGKTFSCMRMALYHVTEKGNQSKILAVREPEGEGKQIGYLKGTYEDKTKNFFMPIVHSLSGGEFELNNLILKGVFESSIPYFMKGTTYNDTIIVVDEAEDLTEKQIRLVGTRVGENGRIFFSGDYKQSIRNSNTDNALVKMCNELKGNPSFGCIYLDEDVRSSVSKTFAYLFQ